MTATQHPSALSCSLEDDELEQRVSEWRRLGREAQLARRRAPGRVVLHYQRDDGVRARLRRLVELEQQCCRVLDLRINETDEAIVLEITGPAEAEPILALFASDPAAEAR